MRPVCCQGEWLSSKGQHRQCLEQEGLNLFPCCMGDQGTCEMRTEGECNFYNGILHKDKQLCSEVACLQHTCSNVFGVTPSIDPEAPNEILNPNQWYRLIWPLFMHAGVIHFILCMVVQWTIGCQIERTAGWLRVALIYLTSGIGGYLVSGIFDPNTVSAGSDPAIFGLLSVLVVELFQSWKVVPNPGKELVKLLLIILIAIIIGTYSRPSALFPHLQCGRHVAGWLVVFKLGCLH
eukprot:m.582264 g.582264  ORF g.582264 m.582264 type:complete len:236 (+) comp22336_c0_seq18:173-880(+)